MSPKSDTKTGNIEPQQNYRIGTVSNELLGGLNRFRRAGYTLDIMRQTACLVFNPIMVEGNAALFSCTAVVQVSDALTASM